MRRQLAVLLAAAISVGTLAAVAPPDDVAGPEAMDAMALSGDSAEVVSSDEPTLGCPAPARDPPCRIDPAISGMMDEASPDSALVWDGARIPPFWGFMEIILLYQNPQNHSEWLPIPSEAEYSRDPTKAVSFANGTQVEVHGKLFEKIVDTENYNYLNVDGIPNMTVRITFDGELVPGGVLLTLNNHTSLVEPFEMGCNGTFEFILDINKPAGAYELTAHFDGYPTMPPWVYQPLTHRTVIFVNHPTIVRLDDLPASIVVGKTLSVSGSLKDETGIIVSSVPLRVMLDNKLLGPASDGLYIDDVEVVGASFSEDFEGEGAGGWTAYAADGSEAPSQWEHGSPGEGFGPPAARSGTKLWGSVLDGLYDRGAWSFLVSPRLDLSACATCRLSFWAWWSLYWDDDVGYVMCSTDDGETWDEANASFFTRERLASDGWEEVRLDLTDCAGSDEARVAFVFYSAGKTLDVRTDGTFAYDYAVPMDTSADVHRLTVEFRGNLLFRAGMEWKDVRIMRIAHFEFEQDPKSKVGHRNEPINLVAWLVDNEGEVPKSSIAGAPYVYVAAAYWGGWSYTHPPLPPERTGRVDIETGKVTIDYVVTSDQALGPKNVTFRFGGSDYYTPAEDIDVYLVKAHTYVKVPDEQERRVYRGHGIDVDGKLLVVPSESIEDTVLGDAIPDELVQLQWGPESLGTERTRSDGSFLTVFNVPRTHLLGDVVVRYDFRGSAIYDNVTVDVTYIVVSSTSIDFGDTPNPMVCTGSWITIKGRIRDDQGNPVPGMTIHIIWKRSPEIGRAVSKLDGAFSLQYYIEYEDRVGNVTVIARCDGGRIYDASEANMTYKVMADTFLYRRDRILSVARGDQAQFSCRLSTGWQEVGLYIDDILVGTKLTAFDGTAIFTVYIDPVLFHYGEVSLVFLFNGSEFLGPSYNESRLQVGGPIIATMEVLQVNGSPFDPVSGVVARNSTIQGSVFVQDDLFKPVRDLPISVMYIVHVSGERMHQLASGHLDETGRFEFSGPVQAYSAGFLYILAVVEGLHPKEYTSPDGQVFQQYTGALQLRYRIPPPLSEPSVLRTRGDRVVEAGDRLELRVEARDVDGLTAAGLNYTIVSAAEGMEISFDGVITWRPSQDQVGEHTVVIWFYSEDVSEAAPVNITVLEEGTRQRGSLMAAAVVIVLCIAIALLLQVRVVFAKRSGRSEG